MPKAAPVMTEEEIKEAVASLKAHGDLTVTRVRELLKVGYTKARKFLDEAMAGEVYVPPVDVPETTSDRDVVLYIKNLIAEKREVKPDILRRDLNIGYKRAKRLIDSLGGNRTGVTVIPPIARKRRGKNVPKIQKVQKVPKLGKRKIREREVPSPDGADEVRMDSVIKRRKTGEKSVPKDVAFSPSGEDEESSSSVEDEEVEDEDDEDEEVEDVQQNIRSSSESDCSSADADGEAGSTPNNKIVKQSAPNKNDSEHDESLAHIMLFLQEGASLPDDAEKAARHHHHHEHGHHHHHHGHGHHHHRRDSDAQHHEHGHHHHHHSHHHRDGHHSHHGHHSHSHHHHHHGHGHHSHHHHHHREDSKQNIANVTVKQEPLASPEDNAANHTPPIQSVSTCTDACLKAEVANTGDSCTDVSSCSIAGSFASESA